MFLTDVPNVKLLFATFEISIRPSKKFQFSGSPESMKRTYFTRECESLPSSDSSESIELAKFINRLVNAHPYPSLVR